MLHLLPRAPRATMLCCALVLMGTAPAGRASPVPPTLEDLFQASSIDGLTPSPDGNTIAFRVLTPDITDNEIHAVWYRVDLAGPVRPIRLGVPHRPLTMPQFGMVDDPVAQWSPDSKTLYILEEQGSEIQVHALSPNDADHAITQAPGDVRSFSVAPDGHALHYTYAANRHSISVAQQAEALRGIHLDQSVITDGLRLTKNQQVGQRETTVRHLGHPIPDEEFATPEQQGEIPLLRAAKRGEGAPEPRPGVIATIVDYQTLGTSKNLGMLPGVGTVTVRTLEAADANSHIARSRIEVRLADGTTRICPESFCSGVYSALREAVLDTKTGEVAVLADEDYTHRLKIEAWNPRTNNARLVWDGDGALNTGGVRSFSACPVISGELVCILTAPTRPAELVAITLSTGAQRVLFDPNAALAAKAYPPVRRLQWQDARGVEGHGVLVEPYGEHRPAPLVVTSYSCGGFLRGSMAEVTPEYILAEHGIASLCFDSFSPALETLLRKGQMAPLEVHKTDTALIASVVKQLADEGIIDPGRVGISGQSYSSNVAAWAISHTMLFKAASMGTGVTIDPSAYFLTAPTSDSWRKSVFSMMGLPRPNADPEGIWARESPALNASHIHAALLIQPPESEYLFALQLYTSIADAGGTVDMYIFPEAGHMLESRPAQLYNRAARSIGWFRYWLAGDRPVDLVSPAELAHWDDLAKARWQPPSPHP